MSEELTALDATFLELEEAADSAHMHIGGAMVFDPLPDGGAPSREELVAHLDARLGVLPRYRQRLSSLRVPRLAWPSWVEDPQFELDGHVRHAALPAPGVQQAMLDWLADFYSHRLDRGRPLWEIVLLEGLDGGRWALCWKTHHCLIDGVGSIDLAHLLLDVEPGPSREMARGPGDESAMGSRALPDWLPQVPQALGQAADAGVRSVRGSLHAVAHPREVLARSRALADVVVREEVLPAPPSSLNRRTGATRRMAAVSVPLDTLRAIKQKHDGTINDVVLAASTAGLRRLLRERGEQLPPRGLRAMVPVNARSPQDQGNLGNRILSLFVALPVADPDPVSRYRTIMAETRELKAGPQALGAQTLLDLSSLAPPILHATLARSLFATRLFNLTITNVPGPQQPLYALGARLRRIIPVVPLAADHGLGIAVLSYNGEVVFSLIGDYETMPDLEVVVAGIGDEVKELLEGGG